MPTVAEFKIEYSQILDPKGRLVAALPPFAADAILEAVAAGTRGRAKPPSKSKVGPQGDLF